MADTGLFALYKLSLVDTALYELKQRASHLDVGHQELDALKRLQAEAEAGRSGAAKRQAALTKDLELQAESMRERLKRLDKDLYGGSVVNPREVEKIEEEVKALKAQIDDLDTRLLQLYESQPRLDAAREEESRVIEDLKKAIARKQAQAKAEHEALQAAYRTKAAERGPLAERVPQPLLETYERLRAKLGIGLATVTDQQRCSQCGVHVPEKTMEMIVQDRVVQCEQCRRILFRLQQG
jgi:predicted  nucleic acid-binding Zn-ribbon protein